MNQEELLPVDPPVPAYEHAGYIPPAKSDAMTSWQCRFTVFGGEV